MYVLDLYCTYIHSLYTPYQCYVLYRRDIQVLVYHHFSKYIIIRNF